jgi:nitroimidazol reductase NimA-like FMN-containing flavoprotein (pyridoxamine 5'-phosphate oxidase superfamily)
MNLSNDLPSLRELVSGMLRTQRFAVLATCGKGSPFCSLVAFAPADGLKTLLFATKRATRKYSHIRMNPAVSILIDTRTNTASDFRDAAAVTAIGTAAEADAGEKDRYAAAFLEKNPELKEFVGSPECGLMKVEVKTYRVVTRFQEVSEIPAGD